MCIVRSLLYESEYKELESLTEDEKKKYTEEGLRVMAKGQFALVLLAGGQARFVVVNSSQGYSLKHQSREGQLRLWIPIPLH